jgi:pyruvate dehydrogenase E1 component beta subunit
MTEKTMSCAKALSEALHEEMARDERVFLIGEDITAHGGNFGQFGGLYERFGERVIDTPISETAIAGAGVGAALTGMRPVVDLYFADFLPVAMDEIVNQDGGGVGAGAHHSQCLESWFVHTPGLKVVVPSEPADVKGLMKAAIRDEDPVMFFQHKLLFAQKGPVPEGEYVVPLGKGEIKRHGKDITILTYSRMTYVALDAAERLAEEGIDSEIVDLKTLKPLDFDLIAESVKKTKHVLVAHEACLTGGFGAEVAARIGEEVFDYLDAPVTRIGAKDTPIPVSPILENFVLPQVDDIVSGAKKVLNL